MRSWSGSAPVRSQQLPRDCAGALGSEELVGYGVAISERLLIDVGIAFLEARQLDLAIRALESNRELFPDSPSVHRFVAIGYEETCRRAEAAASYDAARELAVAHGRPEEARRYGQLADRLRALIAAGAPCI